VSLAACFVTSDRFPMCIVAVGGYRILCRNFSIMKRNFKMILISLDTCGRKLQQIIAEKCEVPITRIIFRKIACSHGFQSLVVHFNAILQCC